MHLLQSGVDLAVIALWLGHESIQTTNIYITADLAEGTSALGKLEPIRVVLPLPADRQTLGFPTTHPMTMPMIVVANYIRRGSAVCRRHNPQSA